MDEVTKGEGMFIGQDPFTMIGQLAVGLVIGLIAALILVLAVSVGEVLVRRLRGR